MNPNFKLYLAQLSVEYFSLMNSLFLGDIIMIQICSLI
jgi:hypothetical protein